MMVQPAHKGCNLAGSSLSIILGEDYTGGASVELYLDNGVNNPSDSVQTTAGFKMQSSWDGIIVDNDTLDNNTHKFTASTALSKTITAATGSSLSFDPKTAGEWSTFTFTFKSSQAHTATDKFVIVFPDEFDAYIGMSMNQFDNEPNTYYIECSSSALGTVWFMVDHWKLWIMESSDVFANTDISITVMHVSNPAAGPTSNSRLDIPTRTKTSMRTNRLLQLSPQQLSDPTLISVRLCAATLAIQPAWSTSFSLALLTTLSSSIPVSPTPSTTSSRLCSQWSTISGCATERTHTAVPPLIRMIPTLPPSRLSRAGTQNRP